MGVVRVLLHLLQGLTGEVGEQQDVVGLAAFCPVDRGQFDLGLLENVDAPVKERRGIGAVFVTYAVEGHVPCIAGRLQTKVLPQDGHREQVLFVRAGQHLLGTALQAAFPAGHVVIKIDGFLQGDLVSGALLQVVPRTDGAPDGLFDGGRALALKVMPAGGEPVGQFIQHVIGLR